MHHVYVPTAVLCYTVIVVLCLYEI